MKFIRLILLLCLCLSGCKVGPNYVPPRERFCDEWTDAPGETDVVPSNEDPPEAWWLQLGDPILVNLIHQAVQFNNDIRAAEANVLQAKAVRVMEAAALYPHLFFDGNGSRTSFSKNGPLFEIPTGTSTGTPTPAVVVPTIPQVQNLFNATLDVSWELDLFGKNIRRVEAAQDNFEAAIDQKNGVLISVIAEVAINYVELRSAQRQAEIIESNIGLLDQTTGISRQRFKAGLINALDNERIEAELSTNIANLPPVKAQIYRNLFALSVLIGSSPEALECDLLPVLPLPNAPKEIALGLRSDILRRRPDVREAERQLAAATANIGVAIASFYPTITLTGDLGFQSLRLQNLLTPKSKTWSYMGDVYIPIFQGGKLVANLQISEAQAAEQYYNYRKTVLNALAEAERWWVAYTQDSAAALQLQDTVRRTAKVSELSNGRYRNGLINMTDWLDTERTNLNAQQNLLNSETQSLLDLIALYKALGGGWKVELEKNEGICY